MRRFSRSRLSSSGSSPLQSTSACFQTTSSVFGFGTLCSAASPSLYVFAIGRRIAGSVCGLGAVVILFVHDPLLFEHGFRSNTLEPALMLCYCGGVYHFLQWTSADRAGPRRQHAAIVGLYFAFGFMIKDVAALFLPFVLGLATISIGSYRKSVLRDWRIWSGVGLLVVALCAPWFVYAYWRFGSVLWQTMLAEHVYRRFTSYIEPGHVQPWYYYFLSIYRNTSHSQAAIPTFGGLVLLTVQTIRRRWPEGLLILSWCCVPLCLLSFGTSKLYHYVYPFLPPLAIAGGYLIALLWTASRSYIDGALHLIEGGGSSRVSRFRRILERPVVRAIVLAITASALAVAIITLIFGPIRVAVGQMPVLKSSGNLRPLMIVLVFGVLGRVIRSAQLFAVLLIAAILPLAAYRDVLSRLNSGDHPMRSASDCVLGVLARPEIADAAHGMYVAGDGTVFGHEHAYYFHRVRPWEREGIPRREKVLAYLSDPSQQRPVMMARSTYQQFSRDFANATLPPLADFDEGVVLLLPGPFAVCATEATGGSVLR